MTKGNTKKAKESLGRQPAAKQSGSAAKISETAIVPGKALKSPAPGITAQPPTASAGVQLETLTPVTTSAPFQSAAKQRQKAPAKSVTGQGSLTTAAAQCLKPAAQPEPIRLPEQAVVLAKAPVFSEVAKVKVTFVFPICECCPRCVSLSGDFNGWSPNATPMKRYDDGHWETTLELAPGRYEYKFVRDGEWMPDLLTRENVLNGYGTLNSVIEVRASQEQPCGTCPAAQRYTVAVQNTHPGTWFV
jgi:hypothetical protein